MLPLGDVVVVDVGFDHGALQDAVFEVDGEEVATARAVAARERSFWGGIGVSAAEWHCITPDPIAGFRWSLHTERRGLSSGFVLGLQRFADAGPTDPLWTVGTLGREGMSVPASVQRGDPALYATAFLVADAGSLRAVRDGEDWARLTRTTDGAMTLQLWDNRRIGTVELLAAHTHTRQLQLTTLDPRCALELALLECVPLAWQREVGR